MIRHQAGIDFPAGRTEHGRAELLDGSTGKVLRRVDADSAGRYRLTKVAPGAYKLVFSQLMSWD